MSVRNTAVNVLRLLQAIICSTHNVQKVRLDQNVVQRQRYDQRLKDTCNPFSRRLHLSVSSAESVDGRPFRLQIWCVCEGRLQIVVN